MTEPIPGSFRDGSDLIINETESTNVVDKKAESKPEISELFVRDLNAFVDQFHPKADEVYYPCSGPDASPSKVFKHKVLYLDSNSYVVKTLSNAGLEAIQEDARIFDPGPMDIVLVYNPQTEPTPFLKNVRENGFLLCNNYHSTAALMNNQPEFTFVGALKDDGTIETENLSQYWEYVSNEDELNQSDPVIANYIRETVLQETGTVDNLIDRYKKILSDHPEGVITGQGGQITILWHVPTKKRSSTYIFQKNSKS